MKRLSAAISVWKDCLVGAEEESFIDRSVDTTQTESKKFKPGGSPEMEVIMECVWLAAAYIDIQCRDKP